MFKKFAIAAVAATGIGYAVSGLTDTGLKACDIDGDGRIHVQKSDGTISAARGWRLAADGTQCVTGGGSTEPTFLPRANLVDHLGKPQPKI